MDSNGHPRILYNTATISSSFAASLIGNQPSIPQSNIKVSPIDVSYTSEPIGKSVIDSGAVYSKKPINQFLITNDTTDYMWYICQDVSLPDCGGSDTCQIKLSFPDGGLTDLGYVYFDEQFLGMIYNNASDAFAGAVEGDGNVGGVASHTLSILSVSDGVPHYALRLEAVTKGITGRVNLNGRDITDCGWYMRPGLRGEQSAVSVRSQKAGFLRDVKMRLSNLNQL